MDWQQPLALLIVSMTAGAFVWCKTHRRKFSFEKDTHCGCSSTPIGPRQTVTFRARKGQRAEVLVKND
jgi:hypothetical protein